jgi:hypothetical protein
MRAQRSIVFVISTRLSSAVLGTASWTFVRQGPRHVGHARKSRR